MGMFTFTIWIGNALGVKRAPSWKRWGIVDKSFLDNFFAIQNQDQPEKRDMQSRLDVEHKVNFLPYTK